MKKLLLIGAATILLAVPAFAQGNTPYNSAGSQAGGPRGGMARAAEPMAQPAPMGKRRMKKMRRMKRMRSM